MKRRLLVVEDEISTAHALERLLVHQGFQVDVLGNGRDALALASSRFFDLIVMDVGLPDISGFELCAQMRGKAVNAPILMLSAYGRTSDKVRGLDAGADDYLTKPFAKEELEARVSAMLRRSSWRTAQRSTTRRFEFGAVTVDLDHQRIEREGNAVALSNKEFALMRYLFEHAGESLSRQELLWEVWGYREAPSTRTLDVHVAWLRQKIEPSPKAPMHILTIPKVGYKFVP